MALPLFKPTLQVTGIDYCEEMLQKARDKVDILSLRQIIDLKQMDARKLDFPDQSFDIVAAMHVLSVVPDPRKVMSEIARVLKPAAWL